MSDTGRPGQKWWKIDFVFLLLLFLRLLLNIRTFIYTFNVFSICVKLKDRKRSVSRNNNHNALWHQRNCYNAKFRVVAVFKQPRRVVACEDMPWCESRVVAVKGNDHNEFGLHESTTNRRENGLSTNVHLLYVRCPIHTAERQWPRIYEQNNTKLGWYVSGNEARAWKAETFSNSRISWKIQLRCSRHAGCLDFRQQHESLVWRTTVYVKQETPSSAFRHQDKPLWGYVWNGAEDRTWGFSAHWRHALFNRNWRRTGTAF